MEGNSFQIVLIDRGACRNLACGTHMPKSGGGGDDYNLKVIIESKQLIYNIYNLFIIYITLFIIGITLLMIGIFIYTYISIIYIDIFIVIR